MLSDVKSVWKFKPEGECRVTSLSKHYGRLPEDTLLGAEGHKRAGQRTFEGWVFGMSDGRQLFFGMDCDPQCCERWDNDLEAKGPDEDGYNYEPFHIAEPIDLDHWFGSGQQPPLLREVVVNDNSPFVEIVTSLGTITFTAYNNHEGYYYHAVFARMGNDVMLVFI